MTNITWLVLEILGNKALIVKGPRPLLEAIIEHPARARLLPLAYARIRSCSCDDTDGLEPASDVPNFVTLDFTAPTATRVDHVDDRTWIVRFQGHVPSRLQHLAEELIYCVIVPLAAGALSRQGIFMLDAACTRSPDGVGMLLSGRGKSTTLWKLVSDFGWSAVAEDTTVLDFRRYAPIANGERSRLAIDERNLSDGTGETPGRGRRLVEPECPWVTSIGLDGILHLEPSEGPGRLYLPDAVDASSWILQAVSAKPLAWGIHWLRARQSAWTWSASGVRGDDLNSCVNRLQRQACVWQVSGALTELPVAIAMHRD